MALLYPAIWGTSPNYDQLLPGYHYKKKAKSLEVPKG